jgi:5-methylcytosine-specific restriction endonuclease McrA
MWEQLSMLKPCIETHCSNFADPLSRNGSRCAACEQRRNWSRNREPLRQHYHDPAYRAMTKNIPCQACGSWKDLTWDHIVPLSKGGSNHPTNLRVLCRPCNSSRGNDTSWRPPERSSEKE